MLSNLLIKTEGLKLHFLSVKALIGKNGYFRIFLCAVFPQPTAFDQDATAYFLFSKGIHGLYDIFK